VFGVWKITPWVPWRLWGPAIQVECVAKVQVGCIRRGGRDLVLAQLLNVVADPHPVLFLHTDLLGGRAADMAEQPRIVKDARAEWNARQNCCRPGLPEDCLCRIVVTQARCYGGTVDRVSP